MNQLIRIAGLAAGLSLAAGAAQAQEKVKVGLLLTLSGPSAVLGQQARDGFQLAVKDMGGKLGGREVEVIVADDELKPDVAVTKVKGLLERDKVDFVVGPIFSNVAVAIHKPIVEAQTFYISTNAGPSTFAGKGCNPYFFATSYQNDQVHEVLGKVAQDRGYKRVYLLAPNYQAGRMPSRASSGTTRARSSRNPTFRWGTSTSSRSLPRSPRLNPTRSSPSCRAAWA